MNSTRQIVYVANARLPTEKAHGYQIVKMCQAFVQNGVKVTLLHPFRQQPGALKGRSIVEYYSVPATFEMRSLPNLDIFLVESLFPKGAFTALFIIHALLWGLYAALKARREAATVYYTRDVTVAYWLVHLRLPTVYEAHVVPKRIQRTLLRRIALHRMLKLVVVLTSFIKERLVEMGFPAEKIVVHPDGADLSLFADLPSKPECRERLGLPKDRPIIGYIGRFRTLDMEKGIPELVQAAGNLPSINGKDPLVLCVGGPMEATPFYLDLARRYGVPEHKLVFVDRVPTREVPFWIQACDLLTIPWAWTEFSAYYTSPMKLFEYMAAGVPIIASDLPSIREVLQHAETAWLVEPGNPEALAKGINCLLRNDVLRSNIASGARTAANKYSWQHRGSQILKAIEAAQ